MTALHAQIDALEAIVQQLDVGDFQRLSQLPILLAELRQGATDLERRQEELLSLYEVGQEIVSILKLDQLLESILDRALMLVSAERGFLVLWDAVRDDFEVPVARRFDQGEVDSAQIEISYGVIRRVLTDREPVVTTNALEDPRFESSYSIVTYQIRSVLAAPMIAKDQLIGAIYVDTRLSSRLFGESELALLGALANQAAVAIQLARLYEDLRDRNRELREALRELQETQAELLQAERLSLVGRMASGLIHDLKGPMTTIKGYASVLGRADLTSEMRQRSSEMIARSVDTFVQMAQEILDYARGGGRLEPSEITVSRLVQDLCDFIELDFEDKGLNLQCELNYTGPVTVDESRMHRALFNLVCNARDAMQPGGSLTIATRKMDGMVEIRLSDTGPGIPLEIVDSVFEPFVTLGKPTGTGLGLAIAKKTIEDHGGTIALDNAPGHGATFIIRVPLVAHKTGDNPT